MPLPKLSAATSGFAANSEYDAVVLVTTDAHSTAIPELNEFVVHAAKYDNSVSQGVSFHVNPALAGGRLIVSCTGPLNRDFDDARYIGDAAKNGVARAKAAGAVKPVLVLSPSLNASGEYPKTTEVALLGALYACYSPLMNREFVGEQKAEPIEEIGVVPLPATGDVDQIMEAVAAVETGRRVARDLCGGDPERTAPPLCAEYIHKAFKNTSVKYTVIDSVDKIKKDYPLAHAVARASLHVKEHHPRIIRLEYEGSGDITEQVFFAGKGITYDTGGADIKAGGIMAGMKRDMGGASAVAGFMRALAEMKPANLRAVAYLGMVRNSVGSNAYVADEIITSHAGKRVLVVNTDAEGRMVMGDLLSHVREEILDSKTKDKYRSAETTVHTVATLTGHALIACGHYSIAMDNGPARAQRNASRLQAVSELYADPFEISTLRRDDFAVVTPKNRDDHDVVQCNKLPSSRTPRGHQFPMAFLIKASGLESHGRDSKQPIAYTHLDIAGSASHGDTATGEETGAPVVGLLARYVLSK